MLRPIVGIFCLIGAAIFLYIGSTSANRPIRKIPGLHITPSIHDFGEVEQQVSLDTQFQVTNDYSESVEVRQIIKGCSCSEAEIVPKVIPPGGEAKLNVRWQIGHKRGNSSEGISLIYSVGDKQGKLAVTQIKAKVHPFIETDPERLEFHKDVRFVKTVTLRSRLNKPFKILGASGNHSCLTVESNVEKSTMDVTFEPTERGWEYVSLGIRIQTSCAEEAEFVLPVVILRD